MLTHRSGLLGVSGISADMRDVQTSARRRQLTHGSPTIVSSSARARAVGAAAGVLGGVDALVFTGGIGEHNPRVRHDIAAAFEGLELDASADEDEGLSPRQAVVFALPW